MHGEGDMRAPGPGVGPEAAAVGLGASAPPLVRALQAFYRAYQKTAIYPPGHPAVPQALQLATADFEAALRDTPSLRVAVARDQLRVRNQPLSEATDALRSLALLLNDLAVAALELEAGLTFEELETFLRALTRARKEGQRGEALVAALAETRVRHIGVVALDYERLSFVEGRRKREASSDRVWDSLTAFLSDSGDPSAGVSAEQLAAEVSREIEDHEGVGVGLLRKGIQRAGSKLEGMKPEASAAVRARLSGFLAALNPRLRRDLLRIDPASPDESLSFMTELVDALPEPDLLEALQQIDRTGARVSSQILTLMNKLLRVSQTRPVLSSGLQDMLDRWGVERTRGGAAATPREALGEVFRQRLHLEFNPKPYESLLEGLSRSALEKTRLPLASRYGDPSDLRDVRQHAVETALQALLAEGGESFRPGLLAYVGAATDELITRGEFELLCGGAMAATTLSRLKEPAPETLRAAQGYLAELRGERRVRAMLDVVRGLDEFPGAALSLLGLGGEAALGPVLDALNAPLSPQVSHALAGFAAGRGAEELMRSVKARGACAWPAVRSTLDVTRRLAEREAVKLLERLFAHEQPRVRLEALGRLCEIDQRPGSPGRHLRKALADPSRRVAAIALRRLGRSTSPGDPALLAECVTARPNRALAPRLAFRRQAARLLCDKGDEGVALLCDSLTRLRGSLHPRDLIVARSVAVLLDEQRANPRVRRSLKSWRLSPLGWISRLLPAAGRERRH
jgi:hypothetical protein